MWTEYYSVTTVDEAVKILADQEKRARIIAGATDLMLEMERGVRKGIDVLIDVTRVKGLDQITLDENRVIHIGPLVTHGECITSSIIINHAFPLARACWEVGAPQIRNRGTIAGNLITASPANDTIPPLMALNAIVELQSTRGKREVPLNNFYKGVRVTVMEADEMLVDIKFPALTADQRGTFYKLGLRKVQAISMVDCAIILSISENLIQDARITLGAVAPTIIHAEAAELFLKGRVLDDATIEQAAELTKTAARPIDDIRSSREYRHEMVRVCVKRTLKTLLDKKERSGYPARPVQLRSRYHEELKNLKVQPFEMQQSVLHIVGSSNPPIETTINGKNYVFTSGYNKSLLRLLREEAGLIGTKEGCAEGECGACTVFLDGKAVMSCLVPATRAHHAQIVTIEGISKSGKLHPIQQAFIDKAAVQCGYCTPGFIMSGVMLLDEMDSPGKDEINQAISGNLCRCTGYYSIVAAIDQAAAAQG